MTDDLTLKQRRFIAEYLKDGNASQAAIRAGYSEDSAGSIGYENLNKPQIAQKLRELELERLEAADITIERVMLDLYRNARAAWDDRDIAASTSALDKLIKTHVKDEGVQVTVPGDGSVTVNVGFRKPE